MTHNTDTTLAKFQYRVADWMQECFGPEISKDGVERNHRFLEEALELVQSQNCTASEAHQLVDYVFNRPVGETSQEVGGVMVTLAAFCTANDIALSAASDTELARIWTKVETIRAKQAAKPKYHPLLEVVQTSNAILTEAQSDMAILGCCDVSALMSEVQRLHNLLQQDKFSNYQYPPLLDDETILKISREYFLSEEAAKQCPDLANSYVKAVRHCLRLADRAAADFIASCLI